MRFAPKFTGTFASLALLFMVASCGDDTGVDPSSPILGNWTATSIVYAGADRVPSGMALSFRFNADGRWFLTATNDQAGVCPGGFDCTDAGNFTLTATSITFVDASTPVVFQWAVAGGELTLSGTLGGQSFNATFMPT